MIIRIETNIVTTKKRCLTTKLFSGELTVYACKEWSPGGLFAGCTCKRRAMPRRLEMISSLLSQPRTLVRRQSLVNIRSAQTWRPDADGEAHVVPRRIKSGQQPELLAVKNFILFHCPLDGVRLRVVPERAFCILQG